jgi:hypothetical protein
LLIDRIEKANGKISITVAAPLLTISNNGSSNTGI